MITNDPSPLPNQPILESDSIQTQSFSETTISQSNPWRDVLIAFLVWLGSVGLLLIIPVVAVIPYIVGQIALMINRTYYPSMTQGEMSWGQGIHWALIIAAVCYLYILFYAVSGSKPNSERYGAAGARS